jgi:uridine phosphorylase
MMPDTNPSEFTKTLYGCDPKDISEVVILTPFDSTLEDLKGKADDVKEFRGFIAGFTGQFKGFQGTVLNSRVGSPVASDCTYYLRFTPCRNIIYTGMIGALQPEIRVGDIIVPTAALRGEGALKYFIDEAYPAVADFMLLRTISAVLENVFRETETGLHYGPIYTTDSFAAETKEFLEEWSARRLLGIEMETSAIYTLASLYGMKAASIHIVSDNPVMEKSFFDKLGEEDLEKREMCYVILLEALVELVTRAR